MPRRLFAAVIAAVALAGPAPAQQGVTADAIRIGSHQDLSGPVAALGVAIREGMALAVDEINEAGGIHGRSVALLVEDTGFDPRRAVLATTKLVEEDRIFALLAPLGSAPVAASMDIALEAGVPVLFSATPADLTYTPFHPLKFGLAPPYGVQVRTMVKFAHEELDKRRFGILYQDDETGSNVLAAALEQLEVHGLEMVERASYKRGDVDFSSQMQRLRAADVDMIILGTIVRETAAAKMEAAKMGWDVDMIVSQAGMNSSVVRIGGEAVDGLYAMAHFLSLNAQEQTPELEATLAAYRAKFGKEPEDGIIYGYFAMKLFAEAAERAGPDLTAEGLAAALESIEGFTTVFASAPATFGEGERLGTRATIVTQVRDGVFTPISEAMTYE